MKRFLITGGAGFIGSAIAKKLLHDKHFVRIIDNQSRGSILRFGNLEKEVEFISSDIRDFEKVRKACENIDTIIHLAFVNGTRYFYEKPDEVLSVGVKGMLNVLDAAEEKGVADLLVASSSEVYQTPPIIPTPEDVPYLIPTPYNPRYSYAGGKIISELLTLYMGRKFLKRSIIFRPHNVYGPNMGNEHVIPQLLLKIRDLKKKNKNAIELVIEGSGKETRSFIFIDDFVEGIILLEKNGKDQEIYNIGTEDEITISNLVAYMGEITSTKISIVPSKLKQGSVTRRCPSIAKLLSLGFRPTTSLHDGLKKTYLWYNDTH